MPQQKIHKSNYDWVPNGCKKQQYKIVPYLVSLEELFVLLAEIFKETDFEIWKPKSIVDYSQKNRNYAKPL